MATPLTRSEMSCVRGGGFGFTSPDAMESWREGQKQFWQVEGALLDAHMQDAAQLQEVTIYRPPVIRY
jgi:hypothetical protein